MGTWTGPGHGRWKNAGASGNCQSGTWALALALDVVHLAIHPINNGELTDHVHVHDPMHNSDLVHVISRYLHSFIVLFLVFYYAM